jgi:hypothetical protein
MSNPQMQPLSKRTLDKTNIKQRKCPYRFELNIIPATADSTHLLTPWNRVLLEKLTGSAASQEMPRIFGTRRFLTVPTSARHLSLSWANSIQSPQPHPTPTLPFACWPTEQIYWISHMHFSIRTWNEYQLHALAAFSLFLLFFFPFLYFLLYFDLYPLIHLFLFSLFVRFLLFCY